MTFFTDFRKQNKSFFAHALGYRSDTYYTCWLIFVSKRQRTYSNAYDFTFYPTSSVKLQIRTVLQNETFQLIHIVLAQIVFSLTGKPMLNLPNHVGCHFVCPTNLNVRPSTISTFNFSKTVQHFSLHKPVLFISF